MSAGGAAVLQLQCDEALMCLREGTASADTPIVLQHSHIDAVYPEPCVPHVPPPVDAARWPDFARARWYEAELLPGDALLLPAYWWHWVFSSEDCVSVQFFHDADVASPDESHWVPTEGSAGPSRDVDRCAALAEVGAAECLRAIEEHRAAKQPLLLPGAAAHWPCMSWTAEGLLEAPDAEVTRYVVSTGRSLCPVEKPEAAYGDTGRSVRVTGSAECLRAVRSAAPGEALQWVLPLTPRSASLLGAVRMPPGTDPRRVSNINAWCNKGHCHTGLHYDKYHNFIIGVRGKKRILLYPQSETPHLYLLPFLPAAIKSWAGEHDVVSEGKGGNEAPPAPHPAPPAA